MATSASPSAIFDEVPGHPGVFVLGCWERQVSIYLQQVRALNLVYALAGAGALENGLTILGGGFAGLTAAVAAARRGARVRLLERHSRLLGAQVGNTTRWIHPHIHEWPRPGSRDPRAGLPVLDWEADLAGRVAESILAQVQGIDVQLEAPTRPLDELERPLILALGLGRERTQPGLTTYWSENELAKSGRYFISGIGEGGLIDCLYATLRDFSHLAIVESCLHDCPDLEARLLEIEADPSGDLTERYAQLEVPAAVDERLWARIRPDTDVILNGSTPQYLSPKADVLNRFLISRLIKLGAVTYRPGRVLAVEEGWKVTLSEGDPIACDRVLLRHGTEPSLKTAFPQLWDSYLSVHPHGPADFTPVPVWPPGFFD